MAKLRRENRKVARLEKKAKNHQAITQYQKAKASHVKSKKSKSGSEKNRQASRLDNELEIERSLEKKSTIGNDAELEWDSPIEDAVDLPKVVVSKKGSKRGKKTNFEKFIELDAQRTAISADEDLELERRLAKKLKVKSGKLRGDDDGFNILFDGLSSMLDSAGEEDDGVPLKTTCKSSAKKKRKAQNSLGEERQVFETKSDSMVEVPDPLVECDSDEASEDVPEGQEHNTLDVEEADVASEHVLSKVSQKYVPPHLRSRGGSELEEYSQIRRRVRGLLNRISESNVESITGEISAIFRSMPRIIASQIISEEVLASCSGGPRGNEQYAAVFSAFVAGMASSVGVDFSAMLMASLAKNFEDEFQKKDNLSLRNLTLLLSYLCIFGVCSSDLIYDFINILGQRLSEVDVSTILTVLQCCGMKIRADDPLSMKNFIVSVQSRVNELKASSKEGKDKIDGKRMEFMLETILDIKNNKKRPKEESSLHVRIKKWLQKLRIDDILLRGLTWSKLLDPEKKGQWWSSVENPRYDAEEVANAIDKEVLEAQKMLQLAAAQRMNTDARKAIFCIIMSSEDYIDAFEKLLRLDLPGKQAREITRVLLDCCLQEKVFNKYYAVLASKLCEHDKGHKFTLQLCIWDHFKEVESMELIRSLNLAKFVAEMVVSFTLSLSVLKAVDLKDIRQLTPKRIMHFRMMFETLFECSDQVIWNVFTRAAVTPDLENLRQGIDFFLKEYLVKSKGIGAKFKLVRKALNNIQGIIM